MVTKLLVLKILQLAVIMALGFFLVKFRVVKSKDSALLSKLSLYLFMPAVIINAFNKDLTNEVLSGLGLAFFAAILIHAALLLIDFVCGKVFHCTSVERASIVYSNSGNLIVPIVAYVLGGDWVIYSCAFLIVALILTWTHEVRLFTKNEPFDLKKILLNVNLLVIVFCFLMVAFGIKLPSFVYEITDSFGACLAPAAMLTAGMLAAEIDFKSLLSRRRLIPVALGRLVVCPIVILLLLKGLLSVINAPYTHKILLISFLASITPSASTVIQMSQVYGDDVEYAVLINFVTMVLCIITMPIFVALF